MENKLILNLRMEESDKEVNFSLLNLILNSLQKFNKSGIQVEYFELRLRPLGISPKDLQKEAYLKIDADDRTFIDSEVSSRWDEAILTSCEKLRKRFLSCKPEP